VKEWVQRMRFTGPLALSIMAMPFSIALCHFALGLFMVSWLTSGHWKEKWKLMHTNYIVAIFLLFFFLHFIGVIYSQDKHTAWFALEKKASLFLLPMMIVSIKLEKEHFNKLLHVFIITCLIATFICLGAALHKAYLASATFNFDSYTNTSFYSFNPSASSIWMFLSYIELASGIGIHPVYLSLYLSFCMVLIINFYGSSFAEFTITKRIILAIIILYLVLFVLFLSSRIMILALLLIMIYGLNQFLKKEPRLIVWSSSFVLTLFLIGIIYLNPVSRYRSYQEIVSTWPYQKTGLQTESTTIRASLWSLSVQSLSKINLLIGTGTGDVEHVISESAKDANITNVLGTNDPHNQYLQTLLGLGILGLICLLICFAWPAWHSYLNGNFLYLGFIFLFSILCLTETAMELQKGIVFYSLLGPLILFHNKPVNFSQETA
jgi:O-antigen ligase